MAVTGSHPAVLDGPASRRAPTRPRPRAPVATVLTARPLAAAWPALTAALHAAHYGLRTVPSWPHLLDAVEAHPVDAVLVDLDALEDGAEAVGPVRAMSGHRLVALLARRARDRHFALIVRTARDYGELEDLVRQGVDALVAPEAAGEPLLAQIQGALRRVARCAMDGVH
jgi:DNA-binding response OmpR family regulator